MKTRILDGVVVAVAAGMFASPAMAGVVDPTPGPAAGVGLAALAALGFGYRALRKRIDR